MAEQVFISYAHEDEKLAHQVRQGLEKHGIPCWIASRNVKTGTDWTASIMNAVSRSDAMLFILSSNSNRASKEVLRELQCADTRAIPIVSLSVGGVSPVAGIEYFLSTQQLLDIDSPPTEIQLGTIVEAVKFHLTPQELYKRKYAAAEGSIRKKCWEACVVQCLEVFESAMKHLLSDLVNSPQNSRTKKAILAAQKTILGKSSRQSSCQGFECFTLPQMIHFYHEGGIFPELKKHLANPLYRVITSTNWQKLEVFWYQFNEPSGAASYCEEDAREISFWTKNLLYESKILGNDEIQQPKPAVPPERLMICASCNSPATEGWHFCPQCGEALDLECHGCHKPLQVEWRRCPFCDTLVRKGHEIHGGSHKLEDEYRTLCRGAWLDGVISVGERRLLTEKRLELGLGADVADRIERECAPPHVIEYSHFVEGVLVDGIITDIEREFLDRKALQLGIDPWLAKETEAALLAAIVS